MIDGYSLVTQSVNNCDQPKWEMAAETYHVFVEALLDAGRTQSAFEAFKVIGAASSS